MSISHNEEAKAADDLFFSLELQGTDGKAATLIYLNGSPEPHLSFGFSSDFFFFFFSVTMPCWVTLEPFQKPFLSFLHCTFPFSILSSLLLCLITGFSLKKAWAVSSWFCKGTIVHKDTWRTEGNRQECALSAPAPETVDIVEKRRRACRENSAHVLFLTSISDYHCWRQRPGLDGLQDWIYEVFLAIFCSQNDFLLITVE